MQISPRVEWVAAREAVARAGPRMSALLRSVGNPAAPAVGAWDIAQLAAHVSHAMDAVTAVAKGGGGLIDDLWGLAGLTTMFVEAETERDLGVLADRIDASVAGFVDYMAKAGADDGRTWLVQGVEFPLSTVTCHVLNELVVHGRDIALADGQRWPIAPGDAALIIDGFIFQVLRALGPSMVDQEAARGVRVTYDIRVKGGGRTQFRFHDGDLVVTPGPPTGRVDCHLLVDPVAFLLVTWARISQWDAIPKGKLLAWGRKPWMGLKLRSLVKNP
jgi:hypothetical protein